MFNRFLISVPLPASLALVGIGLFVGWNSIAGIKTKSIVTRGGTIHRRKNPRQFWFGVVIGLAFASIVLLLGLYNLVRIVIAN